VSSSPSRSHVPRPLTDDPPATRAPAGTPADPILAGLNDEQLAAVTHEGGPLLIVAGAGTGKTAVVTRRIAWLIATRRARPEHILALTFTDKAAAEMESRVDVLVPFGFVGATISTFHAFCARMVRDHAVELGLTTQLRVETPAEIQVFLRERLFDLGLRRYLPLGSPDGILRALMTVFDRARNEDVDPARYLAWAEQARAAAGDDAAARDAAEAQLEVARAYQAYERLLLASGRIDFGAQVGLALRLLRERPYLRREYQERFRFILVDEFQDTDHVQFELVKLLAGGGAQVTVVGDDDQSIYRFRGAKVENLMGFVDAFPGAGRVLLNRNYRSGQRILDAAHRLIRGNDPERLETQLGLDKRLVAQRASDGAPFEGALEHRAHATGGDEAEWVAADIADGMAHGRRASDHAVLGRTHGHLDAVAMALQARGIVFRRVGLGRLYGRPEVALCLNVLRAIASPDEGAPVYMALGDPLFGADPVDLARLGEAARRTHRGLLRVALEAAAAGELADPTRHAVERFAALHRALAATAVRRPTAEVLYQFVHESGLLAQLTAEESADALERVQNLSRLFGIVSRTGALLRDDRVSQFMPHLDLLIELGDDPAAVEVEGGDDAVSLLTAHNAKGLEFPVVYVVHLVEQRFPIQRRGEVLELPPALRHGRPDDAGEHPREERRLCYVALTRARDRLVLSHADDYGGARAARASRFVLETLGLSRPPARAARTDAAETIARFAPVPEPPPAPLAPVPDDVPLALSHYAIEDYRTCPRRYFYSHLAHVPLPPRWNQAYGSAVHHAIRVYLQHRMKGLPIGVEDVLAAYREAWSNEGFLNPQHEEHVYRAGERALRELMVEEEMARRLPLAIEMDFRFKAGRDLVSGRWDRIDETPEGIVLVDYKTTEVEDRTEADARAKDSVEKGQLGLYALAYHETRGALPRAAELRFVGAGVTGRAPITLTALENARVRVAEAAEGIRAARFAATPDAWACGRCDYARFCPSAVRSER
jgi:DNA helicase-2/ATP-dependent DNA helicase PcrA